MKPKNLAELIADAEKAYNRLNAAKAAASKRIADADSYQYTQGYRRQESQAARNEYQSARTTALTTLDRIVSKLHDAAESETPKLSASRLDPNLMNLLTIKGLTENDFSDLAKSYLKTDGTDYANQRAIRGEAKERGYTITNIRTAAEKENAVGQYITGMLEVIRHDDTAFNVPLPEPETAFVFEASRNKAMQMLEPLTADSVKCHMATPEAEIVNDLNASRNSETDDNSFVEGFTGSRSIESADANDYPALYAVADKLNEVQLPEKKERIIDALVSSIDSKRLKATEPLTAEELKAASDKTMNFNKSLGIELKEFADIFVPDEGLQFSPEQGTKLVKTVPSYDSKVRWRSLVERAHSLNTANESASDKSAMSDYIRQHTSELQEKREAEETARYNT